MDLKISNGLVYNGTGAPPFYADIGVNGDRICAVGDLSAALAETVIDAADRMVCPGFIDVHSHSDAYLLIEPAASSKLFQGITTEICGNCGASAAPRFGGSRMPSDWREKTYPGEWQSVAEYRALLEKTQPGPNVALLIGHNAVRASVMGYANRSATEQELQAMRDLLERALDQGGCGLSSGLMYAPGMFAPAWEIEALAAVVARRGGIYTTHMRSESDRLLEAVRETLDLGRRTGCRVQISHLKAARKADWDKLGSVLDAIRRARGQGVDVAADRYPYTAGATELDVILPAWAVEGGTEAILARLRDPELRWRLHAELRRSVDDGQDIMIGRTVHPDNRAYSGRFLRDIAHDLGQDPVETALRLIEADQLKTGAVFFGMSEANMWRVLAEPYVMLCSDASLRATQGPLSQDHPHPRNYGAFPRFLRAALDGKTVSPSEAVRKMTSLPADQFKLVRRGRLAVGCFADIVVIDPRQVRDLATYAQPHQYARGVESVAVNGVLTLHQGQWSNRRAGRFLA